MPVCITCEHASWDAPDGADAPEGSGLDADLRRSHVGWDAGALDAAEHLGRALGVPVFAGRYTRLWVDLNRSADQPAVIPVRSFGVDVPSNAMPDPARQARLAAHWHPWRARVAGHIQALCAQGPVLHVSVHTFTPELDPAGRTYPLGVLFDPDRPAEAAWAARLIAAVPGARANEPYAGTDDGHTTALRRAHADPDYAGIELELNQSLLGTAAWPVLLDRLTGALRALGPTPPRP